MGAQRHGIQGDEVPDIVEFIFNAEAATSKEPNKEEPKKEEPEKEAEESMLEERSQRMKLMLWSFLRKLKLRLRAAHAPLRTKALTSPSPSCAMMAVNSACTGKV